MRRSAFLVLVLIVAGCSTAQAPSPASADPSVEPARSEPPAPLPSLPAEGLTAVTPSPRPSYAVGERVSSSGQADFDCDGKADHLDFYARAGATSEDAPYVARLTLASGVTSDLLVDGVRDIPPLIGMADVNGDGCDDAIVTVGHGASTTWTAFLVYDGAELQRVEEQHKPVMFLFGGSVRHGNAIECRKTKDAPEIVARAASDYTSDYQWDTVEDVHRWATKTELVLWSTTRSVIAVPVRYAMPSDQQRYWGLSCGNVKFPG